MPAKYLNILTGGGRIKYGTKDVSKGFNSSTVGRMLCNNQ